MYKEFMNIFQRGRAGFGTIMKKQIPGRDLLGCALLVNNLEISWVYRGEQNGG